MTEIIENTENENTDAIENLERLAASAEIEEQTESDAIDAESGALVENSADDIEEGARFISNLLCGTICSGAALEPNNRIVGACDAAGQSYARLLDKYAPNGVGFLASPEFAAVVATFNLIAVVKIERRLQHPIDTTAEKSEPPARPETENINSDGVSYG